MSKTRIIITCPACSSGHWIHTSDFPNGFKCDDCGFELIAPRGRLSEPLVCLVCTGCDFYSEGLLRKHVVCYVCDTHYYAVTESHADRWFSSDRERALRCGPAATRLKARVDEWLMPDAPRTGE
jgi:hypothetical protein